MVDCRSNGEPIASEAAAVVELHAQFGRAVDHVVVRDDIAVLGDDDARAAGPALLDLRLAAAAVALREAEKLEERIVAAAAHLDLLDGLDVDHGLHRILGGIGQIGILIGLIGREMGTQCGGPFHLMLDIFDAAAVGGAHRPCRHAARCGGYGYRCQK